MAAEPQTNDHRKRPRRRGDALIAAILHATIEELEERGYAALTMEGVAERARASKASLYRRWPTRAELVMDAVYSVMPDPGGLPDTGGLRGDLIAVLRRTARMLDGPPGQALRGLMAEVLPSPERVGQVRAHAQGMGRQMMEEVTRRAAHRGEISPDALTPRRMEVGQALLRNHFLFHHEPVTDVMIEEIVDEVLLPLFHTTPVDAAESASGPRI
ncbi:TetR/AcrR family transcriptional regulator [Nocardiopsis sp. YSL2]|uniref:TetR/AcrR family transcriptional regulator n=1 Tax=Nocardiopsis sp. YSL2 TaxID=2939492 RepID=UPI0026F46143|nr:TetR/AcrR family transcriptional regulator [Nocardiopsis sp. YSL2]